MRSLVGHLATCSTSAGVHAPGAAGDRPGPRLIAGAGRWRAPRAVHDPGKIIADRAVAVALGGDCLADIAVLRAQPELGRKVLVRADSGQATVTKG